MDQEVKTLLEETKKLVEDNNKILHSIQKRERLSFLVRILYWLVIIGIGVGAFYYVKPYMEQLMKVYQSIKETEQKIEELPSSFDLKTFFKK